MIGLVTKDARFYYKVAKELKGRGLEFTSLKLEDDIPGDVKVVLTSIGEKDEIDFPSVVACKDVRDAVRDCLKISRGMGPCKRLVVGIDPGLKPGIAVLADGVVVEVDHLNSPEEVLPAVMGALEAYGGEEVVVRVGRGGGMYNMRVLKNLQGTLEVPIEAVDENHTNPDLRRASSHALKDIMAAVNIALKNGRVLKDKVKLQPTPGEIRQLQKESRKLSGNLTISKELAEGVAKGELTLEEAIEKHRNGNPRDKKAPFHR